MASNHPLGRPSAWEGADTPPRLALNAWTERAADVSTFTVAHPTQRVKGGGHGRLDAGSWRS